MKKTILGMLMILVVAYVGTSLYFRAHTKTRLNETVAVLDGIIDEQTGNLPGPKFELALKDYHAGFLSGSANLSFAMRFTRDTALPGAKISGLSYSLPLKIYYGPFVFKEMTPATAMVSSQLELPKDMKAMASQQLSSDSTLPQLKLDLLIHYSGAVDFVAEVPPFKLSPKKMPGTLDWQGITATYFFSPDFKNLSGKTAFKALTLKSPFVAAKMEPADVIYDLHLTRFGLWTGESSVNFPLIKASRSGKPLFEMVSLSGESDVKVHPDNLMSIHAALKLKSVTVMRDVKFGPGHFDLDARGLEPEACVKLEKLLQQAQDMRHTHVSTAKRKAHVAAMEQQFIKMVNSGSKVELKSVLDVVLPQGPIKFKLSAGLKSDPAVKRLLDLRDHVTGKFYVQVPIEMVDSYILRQATRALRKQRLSRPYQQPKTNAASTNQQASEGHTDGQSKATSTHAAGRMTPDDHQDIAQLARQKTDNQIKKLLDKKVLVKEGKTYVLMLHYDKGKLTVHGQPFSPQLLQ